MFKTRIVCDVTGCDTTEDVTDIHRNPPEWGALVTSSPSYRERDVCPKCVRRLLKKKK